MQLKSSMANLSANLTQAEMLNNRPELKSFSDGLVVLGSIGPDRMTVSQGAFFLLAGLADQAGKPATFTEIKASLGDAIGRSLHTTYKVFVDEGRNRDGKREPGLGWLTREIDSIDNRRKYLRLTNRGRQVMAEVSHALSAKASKA